jgi:hypothetical protein
MEINCDKWNRNVFETEDDVMSRSVVYDQKRFGGK